MKKYRRRLVATGEVERKLTRATWRGAVGEASAYVDLVDYFDREIDEHGTEETVRNHLDALVDGVSGAAFHGVIRLAYALDAASPRRVSRGLAYLASTAMTLGPLDDEAGKSDDPENLFAELARDASWRIDDSVGNITARMRFVAAQPQFARVAGSLSIGDETPARLAAVALRLYASTDDFTALHGVTGLEAISRLRPYVNDVVRLDRAAFQALAAAYLTIGAPAIWPANRLSEMVDTSTLDEFDVAARAGLSDDEHVAKIVFSSRRLNAASGDPLYLAVAERAVVNDETVVDRLDC
jgi:hypothetical protein